MTDLEQVHIAVVEDDAEISRLVSDLLLQEGFAVLTASSGADLDGLLAKCRPDLVVLDLMLPGEDGLSICRRLRNGDEGLPIIMLTAKSDAIDRVVGLEMGADDYLAKPFNPRELLARVRALLRRARTSQNPQASRRYTFEGLVIDLDARLLTDTDGEPLPLTSAEFDLLACFVRRPRRVLTREQLLDWTRGRSADVFDRSIDMTMSRLRRKIDAALPGSALITTVRNNGYLFVARVTQLPS